MISFKIYGRAQPRGSKVAGVTKSGRSFVRDSNPKSTAWMKHVHDTAKLMYRGDPLIGPVCLQVTFYFKRPKSHYRSVKRQPVLKDDAPSYVTTTPDLTKVMRALEDGLSGVVYHDDRQIARYSVIEKKYTEGEEFVWLTVWKL